MDLNGVLLTDNVGENGTIWIHSRGVLQGKGERDVCQRIRGEPERVVPTVGLVYGFD
jgi:hypothetical protein